MQYKNPQYIEWLKSGNGKNLITIFTPTYNRASLIHRVYECLFNQEDKRFVWIVVNDGSNDNTEDVMLSILEKNELPILFISKSNEGKHKAFEVAFNETRTEYFLCMDDDDIYYPNAVKTFLEEWDRIKIENKLKEIGAIRTITQEKNGSIVSKKPFDMSLLGTRKDQTTLESNYIYHEGYENWTCYQTKALRDVDLFPKGYWMHDQHKFFSESIWQGRFARKYKCRYFFVILREYRHDTETSIIRNSKSRQHYIDMFINNKILLDEQLDYKRKSYKTLIQDIAIVSILRYKLNISLSELLHHTKSTLLKICYVLTTPFASLARKPRIQEYDAIRK